MGLVLGVDSSTQSCKAELRDADTGKLVGTGRAPHPPATGPVSEQDPTAWWQALQTACIAGLSAAGIHGGDVIAISVAAQCHGLVVLDEQGVVIRPAKLWNDTTSTDEVIRLRQLIDDATWARRTGSVPTAAFTIGKVAWLARHEPQNLRRVRSMLLPHDYLNFRLTGQRFTDRSEASGTGYFDASAEEDAGDYLLELLDLVDPSMDWGSTLPRLVAASEAGGTLSAQAAQALGLQAGIPVAAGGGDQHAAALGLGVEPGDLTFSLGTSGVVFTPSVHPVHDASGTVDGVADMTGGYLPLVSTLNAARVTDQFARLLGVDIATLAEMALAAGPGTGPVLVAHLDGERKPDLPHARGLLAGITSATTREEIARAAHEGVLLGLVRGVQHLHRNGVDTTGRVLVVGGGARSVAYRQLLADLLHREVELSAADEATARGACVQAAAVASGADVRSVRDAWRPGTLFTTTPRATDRDPEGLYAQVAAFNENLAFNESLPIVPTVAPPGAPPSGQSLGNLSRPSI
ncbi:xylulokinase [Kineococcus sp. NBC_00420]|uniref:xylulokinase n=1 Tax=Kineococcus sp. NBC_00420 TaxID=2903564 RepID=UPI002E230B21